MGFVLIILFIVVPVLEIAIFIAVGETIGLWPTIITVIATAIIGTTIIKKQGINTWINAQKNFNDGQFPLEDIYKGLCLIVASILLITPGFFTDGIGFLFFVPTFRSLLKNVFSNMLVARTSPRVYTGRDGEKDTTIIDGYFEELKPSPKTHTRPTDSKIKGKD
mgnify:CR=1 FL=1